MSSWFSIKSFYTYQITDGSFYIYFLSLSLFFSKHNFPPSAPKKTDMNVPTVSSHHDGKVYFITICLFYFVIRLPNRTVNMYYRPSAMHSPIRVFGKLNLKSMTFARNNSSAEIILEYAFIKHWIIGRKKDKTASIIGIVLVVHKSARGQCSSDLADTWRN